MRVGGCIVFRIMIREHSHPFAVYWLIGVSIIDISASSLSFNGRRVVESWLAGGESLFKDFGAWLTKELL